jgi:phage gp16-like protein
MAGSLSGGVAMKTFPEPMRKAALAKIHVAKKQLDLDETEYRDLLQEVTGVRSAKDLDEAGLSKVLKALQSLGFKANSSTKLSPKTRDKPSPDRLDKIRAMWIELGKQGVVRNPSEDALAAFVKQLTGIDRPEWLMEDKDWAKKTKAVITALYKMASDADVELR